ncbi:hypothetical protein OSB04_un000564 [Centaurea solstitialis]|uniref:Rab-GAP TBC domain-containing protein n=1 Tax=Centaurea solstitialis TaxID=347529 RepID=A0AA38S3Y7_9ASTR|nr:hypothetical protein OSB04_un000564 [Centaurea solstitialis]
MSPAAPITLPESSSSGELSPERAADLEKRRRFGDLRGVQWRIDLGILPSSSSCSIDELRRVTANCRRSYAALRRKLLINHHPKDGRSFPDLVMDDPLSQNPDSMWGRFFHKAELEKMVDQDLSRLYPEHGSYFQSHGCQGVLRQILLLWCIRHPNYGYQQGMHELLAPLLYVLQADLGRLSEVRKQYQDYFTDNFDGLSFNDNDSSYISDSGNDSPDMEDGIKAHKDPVKDNYLNELDPKIQTIISLSDGYGAEGELGVVLSKKFMEHDAYSMFDVLMNGDGGAVAMSNFFSHSPVNEPQSRLPPVLEASSALYHLLSLVDLSLYTHLVELGVEPQYFALRWLRVLFGREFALEDLLVIWDEIFALDNGRLTGGGGSENEYEVSYGVLKSSRGAFISALAVSMILYLRSSVLATENATSCLQRLLNFPEDVKIAKLIKKAKSLTTLATNAINSKPVGVRGGQSLSPDLGSPHGLVRESYWEEKWRVLAKEEEERRKGDNNPQTLVRSRLKGWSERVKLRLSRTESAKLLSKVNHKGVDRSGSPIRKNLSEDLSRQMGSAEEDEKLVGEDDDSKERFSSVNGGSEENSSFFDHGNGTKRSCMASISSVTENHHSASGLNGGVSEEVASPLPVSDPPEDMLFKEVLNDDDRSKEKSVRERRLLAEKLQWLWMFAKTGPEGSSSEEGVRTSESSRSPINKCNQENIGPSSSTTDGTSKPEENVDRNKMSSLKDVAQSMLEHIEVIESVFEQEKAQTEPMAKNSPVGKEQSTAMASLKELRKISNLLSEM